VYETKVKRKIDEINLEIRHIHFNVIIIMRAFPLIDIKNNPETNTTEIAPIGFPIKIASVFKNDLIEALSATNKVLCMRFSVLTRKELVDSIHSGCRVLQLNCNYTEDDCLCLEGPYGSVDRVPFKEIQEIFSPKPGPSCKLNELSTVTESQEVTSLTEDAKFTCKLLEKQQLLKESHIKFRNSNMNSSSSIDQSTFDTNKVVDVLILGSNNSWNLVNLFISLKIPHIIIFNFSDNEKNFRLKQCENECINYFSLYFYQELVAQKTVFDAYDIACSKVFDYLGEKYFDGKPKSFFTQVIGAGPLLLPEDTDHNEVLFGHGRFPLAVGELEDISNTISPTNIEKLYLPFTARCIDFYNVVKKLTEHRGFLELTGPRGAGKTTFVLQLGYYLLKRSLFHDGIFYIPMKYLKKKAPLGYQFKDLIKDVLGLNIQYGFKSCLKGKNMLIIFDDFDMLYKEIEFCRLFFRALKECNIPCIAVCTSEKSSKDNTIKRSKTSSSQFNERKEEIKQELFSQNLSWELLDLTQEELALTLHALIKDDNDNNFISIEELKQLPVIHQAHGNPRHVIDQLLEGNIQVRNKTVQIDPFYKEHMDFEEHYMQNKEISGGPTPYPFTRNLSHQVDNSPGISFNEGFGVPEYIRHKSYLGPRRSPLRTPLKDIPLLKTKSVPCESADTPDTQLDRQDSGKSSNSIRHEGIELALEPPGRKPKDLSEGLSAFGRPSSQEDLGKSPMQFPRIEYRRNWEAPHLNMRGLDMEMMEKDEKVDKGGVIIEKECEDEGSSESGEEDEYYDEPEYKEERNKQLRMKKANRALGSVRRLKRLKPRRSQRNPQANKRLKSRE